MYIHPSWLAGRILKPFDLQLRKAIEELYHVLTSDSLKDLLGTVHGSLCRNNKISPHDERALTRVSSALRGDDE
jgi:hypothetical protein